MLLAKSSLRTGTCESKGNLFLVLILYWYAKLINTVKMLLAMFHDVSCYWIYTV